MKRTQRSFRATGNKNDKDAGTGGIGSGSSPEGGTRIISKDDYIKKLQAELERLKAEQGIGSPSNKLMLSQSPVSKRKRGSTCQ